MEWLWSLRVEPLIVLSNYYVLLLRTCNVTWWSGSVWTPQAFDTLMITGWQMPGLSFVYSLPAWDASIPYRMLFKTR